MSYRMWRMLSIALVITILISGFSGSSAAWAKTAKTDRPADHDIEWQQDRGPGRREERRMRREERQELTVVRELDREHRLRYRMNNQVKGVGYIDNFGAFHFYGYYDPYGFFHRY